jgi:hypothetical protein
VWQRPPGTGNGADIQLIEPSASQKKSQSKEYQREGERRPFHQAGRQGSHRQDDGNHPKYENKVGQLAHLCQVFYFKDQPVCRAEIP